MTCPYQSQITAAAAKHGLDPCLVAAVCSVESSFMPDALRYEGKFQDRYIDPHPQYCFLPDNLRCLLASSLGLMQVMGLTAAELGLSLHHLESLFEVEEGLEYGCRVLADKVKKYGDGGKKGEGFPLQALEPAIAAYNSGTPRKGPKGNWVNFKYVLKVMRKYQEYKKA